jgi:hypothetical protein
VIRFKCQLCGQKIRTSDENSGKKGKCPKCKSVIIIPFAVKSHSDIEIVNSPEANAPIGLGNINLCEDIEPDYEKKWYSFLIPKYNELSTFLMGISLILLTIVSSELRKFIWTSLFEDWRNVFLLFMAVGSLCVCLYHPFTTKKKNPADRLAMLCFAVLINGGAGILSGDYMLKQTTGWLAIFPTWNIINGILLLAMFRYRYIDERSISGRDTNITEIVISLMVLITIFTVCNFIYKLYWAITLSICIAYATSLSNVFHGQQQTAASQAISEPCEKR